MNSANKICTINVAGLRRKVNNIKHLIKVENITILAIQETKLPENFTMNIHTHILCRKDHKSRSQGVGHLIHRQLPSTPHTLPQQLQHLQVIAADVLTNIGQITFFSYHNHPQTTINEELLQYVATIPQAVIKGDFNACSTSFDDETKNINGEILEDILISTALIHLQNSEPTYIGRGTSILDHITYTPSLITQFSDAATLKYNDKRL